MGDDSTDPEITLSSYREEWNVFSLPLTKGDICMGKLKSKASFSESQEKGQHFWEPLTYPQSPPPLPHSQWSANPPGPLNPLLQYLFGNIWYGEEESEIQNQTLRTIFSYGFMEKKIRHPAFDLGPQPYTCFPLHLSRGSPWCPASPTTGTPNTGPCCLKNLLSHMRSLTPALYKALLLCPWTPRQDVVCFSGEDPMSSISVVAIFYFSYFEKRFSHCGLNLHFSHG